MGLLTKIADSFGGSLLKEGFDIVKSYFPPSMSDKEKKEAELAFTKFAFEREKELTKLANEAEQEFNNRIKDLEGTASDLKSIPLIGTILIFVRGAQRPVWGLFTLYADYMVFSKQWDLATDPQLKSMMLAINLLVLGFLFGERAIKNVAPFIREFVGKGKE